MSRTELLLQPQFPSGTSLGYVRSGQEGREDKKMVLTVEYFS